MLLISISVTLDIFPPVVFMVYPHDNVLHFFFPRLAIRILWLQSMKSLRSCLLSFLLCRKSALPLRFSEMSSSCLRNDILAPLAMSITMEKESNFFLLPLLGVGCELKDSNSSHARIFVHLLLLLLI